MFSRWLRLNHRLRLSAFLTLTVSAALACVFLVVVLVVRGQTLDNRFVELEAEVNRIAADWNSSDALTEFEENFPGVEMAVYENGGLLLASTTRRPRQMVVGRTTDDGLLIYGLRQGSHIFVGGAPWKETQKGLNQLALVLAVLWLPLTLLVAGVSWYGGGLVLRPVRELLASAERLSGSVNGQVLSTTDLAEFGALARSLNQLIERVRHSASLQEQFASDAAHELRTPLALLRTRIETNLQRNRTPDEHVASQKAMLRQIERLTSIVESLLRSARQIGSGAEPVNFGSAVQKSVEDWAELRDWPANRLRLEIQPCFTRISMEEITIIVRNLLDNAARHSPSDSPIEVCVSGDRGHVTLRVQDFGPGLSADEMSLAFERFYRSDEGRSREEGGAGIGLSVVKRIVETYGGHIEFLPTREGALIQAMLPKVAYD